MERRELQSFNVCGRRTEKVNIYKIECKEMELEIKMDKSEVMIVGGERKHKKTVAGMRVQPEIRYLRCRLTKKEVWE